MMTNVGPPEPGDIPRKPGVFTRSARWFSRGLGLMLLARMWRMPGNKLGEEALRLVEGDDDRSPSHGLPEADLTDEQRDEALHHLHSEDAIRRAKGER